MGNVKLVGFGGAIMNHIRGSYQLKETKIYEHNQCIEEKAGENPNLRSFYAVTGKRVLDLTIVLIGAPFVLPILLIVASVIKLDGGTVIYRQKRIGIGGREFNFLKFRSMMTDSDLLLQKHFLENPAAAAEWETMQKLDYDPRVTKFGRFIRKTSLDELPQLWNVLIGDMSLVGPRPMLPEQQKLYSGQDYKLMKPGITGVWQVSARNEVSFSRRAVFDSVYAQNIGFWFDLKILFQTIGAIFKSTGC